MHLRPLDEAPAPHVVEVHDAGFDERLEIPFLVMELLEGSPISEMTVPMQATAVIEYLRQTAEGLDSAHGYCDATGKPNPIVYRDLTPDNIFVTEEARKTRISATTFGGTDVESRRSITGASPAREKPRPVSTALATKMSVELASFNASASATSSLAVSLVTRGT